MLKHILDAHGGELPADVIPIFCNTGKEMPQTLDFVRDCGEHWGVRIVWLEYRWRYPGHDFEVVDYEHASRHGEPYEQMIDGKGFLPNRVSRFCTIELKIRTMRRYTNSLGWGRFTNYIGLRADEPARISRLRAREECGKDGWSVAAPLADAGVTRLDVAEFWKTRNFDLNLPNINGSTPLGNCDLCFLKNERTIMGIMRQHPELAGWWIAQEERVRPKYPNGARFRDPDEAPSYVELLDQVQRQGDLIGDPDDDSGAIDCFCHD